MHSTYNSYIFQVNLKGLFAILIVHRLLWAINISFINSIIESKPIFILELLMLGRCSYNLWFCTKHITTPYILSCRRAWWDYMFVLGPISQKILGFFRTYFLPTPAPPIDTTPKESVKEKVSVIDAFDKAQAMFPPMIHQPTQYSFVVDQNPIQLAALAQKKKEMEKLEKDRRIVEHLLFGSPEPKEDSPNTKDAVFRFVPSMALPPKPLEKRDRNLWHLARTKKLIADFKREQLEVYHQEWNKFNDQRTREHYHKLSEVKYNIRASPQI
ncbi:hypothetical protein BY458DRAFT_503510 [Sporodiniella umbellata]|nr:hypothetical protein BY458DRAFT_503510 [Sporodiniella umbellata]